MERGVSSSRPFVHKKHPDKAKEELNHPVIETLPLLGARTLGATLFWRNQVCFLDSI